VSITRPNNSTLVGLKDWCLQREASVEDIFSLSVCLSCVNCQMLLVGEEVFHAGCKVMSGFSCPMSSFGNETGGEVFSLIQARMWKDDVL